MMMFEVFDFEKYFGPLCKKARAIECTIQN